MLTQLSIRNIVLIEAADIPFADGLCVLTGETGAGKSILLDALGLVLGRRGESRLVRTGADSASVNAEFNVAGNEAVSALLAEYGLPQESPLILRRILQKDGGGRAFINGEAVPVATLKALGELLVEIHGQHDQRGLMDASTHALALDRFARLDGLREEVASGYAAWKAARASREALEDELVSAKREEDFLTHMEAELSKLAPAAGEEEELSEARRRMMQNEKMASLLRDALGGLQDGERSVLAGLRDVHRLLARSSLNTEGQFDAVLESLDRALHEAATAEDQLESKAQEMEYDAGALERMEERLFALKAAARKYQTTADALPQLLEETRTKLQTLSRQDAALDAALKAEIAARSAYVKSAEKLAEQRAPFAQKMQDAMHAELAPLKMGATQFHVTRTKLDEAQWNAGGIESVKFEVATNAGSAPGPLGKIASGGELSRLMLALKVILADVQQESGKGAATLIFDEIDTGTGGATADAIGARLAQLGDAVQVLVVTHLPQVAAKGAHHLKIEKEEAAGHTRTDVTALDKAARKQELARMLSGAEVTKEALTMATKLMGAKTAVGA
jgi:DNA repair protein RecN (Recombination protein N)